MDNGQDKTSQDNVINLSHYSAHMKNLDTTTSQVLNECRELMTDRLSQSLTTVLDKTDDLLFDLARNGGPAEHPFYFNAMREMRLKRSNIEAAFKENFVNLFNDSVRSGGFQEIAGNKEEDVDIEETLALSNTAGKIRHDCHHALLSLDQRMQDLLGSGREEKLQNPMRPETVCTAFQKSCIEIESGIEIKLILFKLFEQYIAAGLQDAYTDIDALITEKKHNPQGKPSSATYAKIHNAGIIRDKTYFIVANRTIRNEINEHLGEGTVPVFIKDFLFTYWGKLMLKIYIKEGTDSKAWVHAVDVIDDLVNCIGSKSSMAEKLNLAPLMHNIIQRIKYGMNVIPVPPAMREEFLSELNLYHRKILKSASTYEKPAKKWSSEDITIPKFTNSGSKQPFMDELFADNKPDKSDIDLDK